MKLVSLNVGKPMEVQWRGETIVTSIFKYPVTNQRRVSFLHIEGDEQSDLRVHGGINKAVYAYDLYHYQFWYGALPREDWMHGMFGENLTTAGLRDDEAKVGDIYQVGTAKLQVVQPRFPCVKINVRFGKEDMIERFIHEKRAGIYFKVIEEGYVKAGDAIALIEPSIYQVTIQDYVECYYTKGYNKELVHTILSIPFLPERQRSAFASFLS